MKAPNIIIEIEGKKTNLDVWPVLHIVSNTISLLRKIEKKLTKQDESRIAWKIKGVQMKSPLQWALIGEYAEGEEGVIEVDPVAPYIEGIDELENKGTKPECFDYNDLSIMKKMLSYQQDGIAAITFRAPKQKPVTPSNRALGNLYLLTAFTKPYWTYAQIEGRLDDIAAHTDKPQFIIYDPLTDDKIKCDFEKDEIKSIRNLVTERVRVSGNAKFNEYHRPVEIQVESYQRLKGQNELPQISDLHKAHIDITGGIDSVAFIEELRGEETN